MPNPPTPTHVPDTISHELADKHARGECGGKCVLCCQVGESHLKRFAQFVTEAKEPRYYVKQGTGLAKNTWFVHDRKDDEKYGDKNRPRGKGSVDSFSTQEKAQARADRLNARFGDKLDEDAPANAAGTGAVAGLTGDPPVRKKKQDDWKQQVRERIQRAFGVDIDNLKEGIENNPDIAVVEVDSDRYRNARFGKNRYHRYSKYVGEDETGQKIREIGRTTKKDIILKDSASGTMQFFRRKGGKLT